LTDPTPPIATGDTRFVYQKIGPGGLTEDQINAIGDTILDPNVTKSYFAMIFALIRMLAILAYVYAHAQIVATQALLTKQKNEQDGANKNQGDIDHDDLGGVKR
jgi:hypothetical protein